MITDTATIDPFHLVGKVRDKKKYNKLLSVGVPMEIISYKMVRDGYFDKGYTHHDIDESKLQKYEKMWKVGISRGAILQKMMMENFGGDETNNIEWWFDDVELWI